MQSFVYHLLQQPHNWRRIRSEMDAAQKDGHFEGRVVRYEDAARLPFLEACVKEALRIMPPITCEFVFCSMTYTVDLLGRSSPRMSIVVGLQRVVPKGGIVIGETSFQEGTILSISPAVSLDVPSL